MLQWLRRVATGATQCLVKVSSVQVALGQSWLMWGPKGGPKGAKIISGKNIGKTGERTYMLHMAIGNNNEAHYHMGITMVTNHG